MSRLAVMSVLVFCGTVGCGRITFDPVAFYNPYAKPPAGDGGTSVLDPYANQDAGLSIGLPECGNGVLEIGEACDGLDLGETSCASFLMDGDLACNEHCDLDLSGCISTTGGGGPEDGGTGVSDGGQPQNSSICGDGTIEPPEFCDGEAIPPGVTCDIYELGATGTVACKPDCSLDFSNCESPPPQCRQRTAQDINLFLVATGLYDFFGSSGSSCVACHQYVTTATNVYTWDTDNPNVMRSSLLSTVSSYPTISHYNDGPNYGRVLGETDIPELSILAYKSKLGIFPPTDSEHNNHHLEFINADGTPSELGESLLTFIDFFIHPNEHQICE